MCTVCKASGANVSKYSQEKSPPGIHTLDQWLILLQKKTYSNYELGMIWKCSYSREIWEMFAYFEEWVQDDSHVMIKTSMAARVQLEYSWIRILFYPMNRGFWIVNTWTEPRSHLEYGRHMESVASIDDNCYFFNESYKRSELISK